MQLPKSRDELVDPEFIAHYYNVSERTVAGWRLRGQGPKYLRISQNVVRYMWGAVLDNNDEIAASSTSEESAIGLAS